MINTIMYIDVWKIERQLTTSVLNKIIIYQYSDIVIDEINTELVSQHIHDIKYGSPQMRSTETLTESQKKVVFWKGS